MFDNLEAADELTPKQKELDKKRAEVCARVSREIQNAKDNDESMVTIAYAQLTIEEIAALKKKGYDAVNTTAREYDIREGTHEYNCVKIYLR